MMVNLTKEDDVVTVYVDHKKVAEGVMRPGDHLEFNDGLVDFCVVMHENRLEVQEKHLERAMDKNPVTFNVADTDTNHAVRVDTTPDEVRDYPHEGEERRPEIFRAMDEVGRRLSHLDEALDALSSRLAPVMNMESAEKASDVKHEAYASTLAKDLQDHAVRVERATCRVSDLVDRLQV